MRRNAITSAVQEESDEINLTPMLDVVFIMLIFFIVTANLLKNPVLKSIGLIQILLKLKRMPQFLLLLVRQVRYGWTEEELM